MSSINGTGKTRKSKAKELTLTPISYPKIYLKWTKEYIRHEMIKILKEDIGSRFFDIDLGNDVFWI